MTKLRGVTLVFLLIAAVSAGRAYEFYFPWSPETVESMEIEIESMQMCMQSGNRSGCSMDIQDFQRYHELRHKLKALKTQ